MQVDDRGEEHIERAIAAGVEPQFWGGYVQQADNALVWLKDYDTEQEAHRLTELLTLIDAASEKNEQEKSLKLASIHKSRTGVIQTAVRILDDN